MGLLVALTACSSNVEPQDSQSSQSENADETTESSSTPAASSDNPAGSSLVAYFSYSGNTQQIAESIAEKTGSEVFEITTAEGYPEDYDSVVDLAQEERNDQARPELGSELTNLEEYDTIYLGYPIWWSDMPMAVYSFLDDYDLAGKRIVPFCTHGGSGLSSTDTAIADEEPEATVLEGLALWDSAIDDADAEIDEWLAAVNQ
ncbi:NAD(P)H-dependent oxidoreductase [Enterococcus sp. 669A]|uniref:NAD(P)H-dependent oxidoreductase n=2 Tax=Candidatus Enterococcus moelleringii TaxID=2815325 RepID=A0ABS3L7N2_9ENTE|nr:NAD(P)H-dependent oxidoreductase [Enterococcus sp. 669A]